MPPQFPGSVATGLTITNPLVLYRTLIATKRIEPDPAQHRLALELQKLYFRLKDYSPQADYGEKLKAISRAVEESPRGDVDRQLAVPGHPLRRNPLFAHLFKKMESRNTVALTRVLTSHEAAMDLKSPRGLLLHGEVGTGKSMLVDLLADSLPNSKKRRWHFNTFMLETLSRLEYHRQSRAEGDSEYGLIWLAKEMIEKSPILFLDEFQLPDRAASKILSNLLTPFFQLGGVLIASSNRMPDELTKASGMFFAEPQRRSLMGKLLGGNAKPTVSKYGQFVEVLKARCDIWDMEGGRDWRRREAEGQDEVSEAVAEQMRGEMVAGYSCLEKREVGIPGLDTEQSQHDKTGFGEPPAVKALRPKKYLLFPTSDEETWHTLVQSAISSGLENPIAWKSTTVRVYGRLINVPRHKEGVTYWTFDELCKGTFGPADYITLASTFHTLILDDVPILTLSEKNEARRLITLLDALYEARCKLIIRAEAGPDGLFFPEIEFAVQPGDGRKESYTENDGGDAVYPETLSEIYQDQTSPFRPNISSYVDGPKTGYDPTEDSDFGPIPGKGNEVRTVDFGMTSSFTGEDERFAYGRARSRLWEMCGERWHERSDPGWWRPLPLEVRRWEQPAPTEMASIVEQSYVVASDVKMGEHVELEKHAGLQRMEELDQSERDRNK